MTAPNLFISLEHYAKENFATETLAYILKKDATIRHRFLRLLRSIRPESVSLNVFSPCDIRTQVPYDGSIIDLEITPKSAKRRAQKKLQVEVKTQSKLQPLQIQRYLKLNAGHVALLTPRSHPPYQSTKKSFLGHFYWEDVYSVIRRNCSRNPLYEEFLKYLKERNMSPQQPFTSNELKTAAEAMHFLVKSQAIVHKVQSEILKFWENEFGENWAYKKLDTDFAEGDAYSWWYRAKGWRQPNRSAFLELGVAVMHTPNNKPHFFVGIGTWHAKFSNTLKKDLHKKHTRLTSLGWTSYPEEWRDWGYRKFFELTTGDPDKIATRQISNVKHATQELRRKDLQIINLLIHRLGSG